MTTSTDDRLVFLTGAGISVPSGLPTYRESSSHWKAQRLEEMSRASRYGMHLGVLWDHWEQMRSLALASEPNAAHEAIASTGAWVITQNIDGLHLRAGSPTVELHGTIHRARCRKRHVFEVTADSVRSTDPGDGPIPLCPECGSDFTRPDIVLFEESIPRRVRDQVDSLVRRCEVLVVVGTSGHVHPAAGLPDLARENSARTVYCSADPWQGDHVFDEVVLGDAAEVVPALVESLRR